MQARIEAENEQKCASQPILYHHPCFDSMAFASINRTVSPFACHTFPRKSSCVSLETKANDYLNNETVTINISGKKYETFLSTIERFPNSLLGDPLKRIHFFNHDKREYFFDRHRKSFSGILHYYQSNGILERPPGISEKLFTQEVMFFELGDSALEFTDECNGEDDEMDFQLPSNPFFRTMWILFEKPKSSLSAKILAVFSVLIILLSIVVFCIETIPHLNPDHAEGRHMEGVWFLLNTICNAWFTLEYLLRFISSPQKLLFIRSALNVIDLISILPYYLALTIGASDGGSYLVVLRVVRVVRVVRIFKLTRHSRGLHVLANTIRASFHELAMLVMFLAIGVILFASAVYFAESQDNGTDFQSIPHSFWWAVVTMTTVGYGDLAPSTLIGKLIGTLCAISGVLVIALPVPVIVSNFEFFYKAEQCRRAREEEIVKKEKLNEKLEPMKESLQIMTDASIIIAGGDSTTNLNNNNKEIKDTKITIHAPKKLTEQFYCPNKNHYAKSKNGSCGAEI